MRSSPLHQPLPQCAYSQSGGFGGIDMWVAIGIVAIIIGVILAVVAISAAILGGIDDREGKSQDDL